LGVGVGFEVFSLQLGVGRKDKTTFETGSFLRFTPNAQLPTSNIFLRILLPMKSHFSLLSGLLLATSLSFAATPAPTASFRYAPATFKGDSTRLIVKVVIPKGWHIQSNAPLDEFLIPTELKTEGEGLSFGKVVFPKPILEDFPALGGKVALFAGTIEVKVPVARKNAKVTQESLESAKVVLRYQACNDSQCLPPKEVTAKYEASK
jgi:hypothetical protein